MAEEDDKLIGDTATALKQLGESIAASTDAVKERAKDLRREDIRFTGLLDGYNAKPDAQELGSRLCNTFPDFEVKECQANYETGYQRGMAERTKPGGHSK